MDAKSYAQETQDNRRLLGCIGELCCCLPRKRRHTPSNQPHPERTPSPTESQGLLFNDTVEPATMRIHPYISETADTTIDRVSSSSPSTAVSEVYVLHGPESMGGRPIGTVGEVGTVRIEPSSTDMPGPNAGSVTVDMDSKRPGATSGGLIDYAGEDDVVVESEDENQRQNWATAMQIHHANDPEGLKTQHCLALIDSGSGCCVTSRKVIKEIGAQDNMYSETHQIKTVKNEILTTTGVIMLRFNLRKNPSRVYWTKFLVLDEGEPGFDFLLGRNWISKCTGGITRDFDKIPNVWFFA